MPIGLDQYNAPNDPTANESLADRLGRTWGRMEEGAYENATPGQEKWLDRGAKTSDFFKTAGVVALLGAVPVLGSFLQQQYLQTGRAGRGDTYLVGDPDKQAKKSPYETGGELGVGTAEAEAQKAQDEAYWGSVTEGAATGAGIGAGLGPVGMVVGAIVGAHAQPVVDRNVVKNQQEEERKAAEAEEATKSDAAQLRSAERRGASREAELAFAYPSYAERSGATGYDAWSASRYGR